MDRRGMLKVFWAAAGGIAVVVGMGLWVQAAQPPDQPKPQKAEAALDLPTRAALRPSRQKLLEDQRAVLKELHSLHDSAGLLGPSPSYVIETEYLWSRRLLEVERDLGTKEDARITALQDHLDRMKSLEVRVNKFTKTKALSEIDALSAKFYRLEAEYWLERTQTR